MVRILELDPQGELRVPAEVLRQLPVTSQYQLEIQDGAVILRPIGAEPFWQAATSAERANRWRDWASQERPRGSGLPNEALHRDAIYGE